jgi:hypothetical protein
MNKTSAEEIVRLKKIIARQHDEAVEAKKEMEWGQNEASYQRMKNNMMLADLDDLLVLPSELDDETTWASEWSKDPLLARWSADYEDFEIGNDYKLAIEVRTKTISNIS